MAAPLRDITPFLRQPGSTFSSSDMTGILWVPPHPWWDADEDGLLHVTTAASSAWTHDIPRRKQRILLYIYFKNYLVVLYIDVGCLCYSTFPLLFHPTPSASEAVLLNTSPSYTVCCFVCDSQGFIGVCWEIGWRLFTWSRGKFLVATSLKKSTSPTSLPELLKVSSPSEKSRS